MDSRVAHATVCGFLVMMVLAGVSCNYSFNNYNPSSGTTFTLSIADLENASALTGEKTATSFRLLKTGTAEYGCNFDSGAANSASSGRNQKINIDYQTSDANRSAVFLTPATPLNIQSVKLLMQRKGGVKGSVSLFLGASANGTPTTESSIASSSVDMESGLPTHPAQPAWIDFMFSGGQVVSAGQELSLILTPLFSVAGDGFNYINLISTNDSNSGDPIACNAFPVYKVSTDSGLSWLAPTTSNVPRQDSDERRGYFLLVADVHSPSANGHWSVDGTISMDWNMSTFTITENPSNLGGEVTYDVGAANTSTPTYSHTGLTKAQVQALTGIRGQYLFIKVNLTSSSAPYFERAEVSSATIQASKTL